MAHHTLKTAYRELANRLNRSPQGAPESKRLFQILSMLFDEKEAKLVSLVPIKPFTVDKAAAIWKMKASKAQTILDSLADRAILVDMEQNGVQRYVLPPPMAGFFEFSLMRVRGNLDQKVLSELFYDYMNVEEDFIRELFTRGETQLGRVFVQERSLSPENALHVLDYERATEVIKTADHIGVGVCYCRHKMQHVGRDCDAPKNICMTFNTTAASLIKHGHARSVDTKECLDLLESAYGHNLVQFGENVRQRVNFICNCCGCCCEAMIAARRFAMLTPVHTTAFLPELDESTCTGCGKCATACPVAAMTLVTANAPSDQRKKVARLNEELCLGCGVCVRTCTMGSLSLKSRPSRVITPRDAMHRTVVMAIERDKLQHLIFDNRVLFSHRALAALLGVILKLPPIKQLFANRQIKSHYLEALLARQRL